MRLVRSTLVLALIVCAGAAARARAGGPPPQGATPPPSPALRVALTVDDLPVHSALPPGLTRVDVARAFVAAFKSHRVPEVFGFVNANGLAENASNVDVLRTWRSAGYPLGNHTWSHADLDAVGVEAFEKDIVANEPTLREHMGEAGWRWLRFPYLREGSTPERREAVSAFLRDRGYRVAPATISFGDWAYNEPFARCLASGDRAAIDWMKSRYLEGADEAITAAAARPGTGVVLLHLGAFDAVMMPAFLDLLERRGVTLVRLDEAAAGIVPPSAAQPAARPNDTMARLAALCK